MCEARLGQQGWYRLGKEIKKGKEKIIKVRCDKSKKERKQNRKKKVLSTWTPFEITSGEINSGSSGSNSHTLAHRELISVILLL